MVGEAWENALRANPQDLREQYEKQLKDLQEAYVETMLELVARKEIAVPAGRGREMIAIREGLHEDGHAVSIRQLCRWVGNPRRTVYYRSTKKSSFVTAGAERFAAPIKRVLEEHPSFGIGRRLIY